MDCKVTAPRKPALVPSERILPFFAVQECSVVWDLIAW